MARLIFDFAILAALFFIPSQFVLGDDGLLMCQQTSASKDMLYFSSRDKYRLIVNPNNIVGPCESVIPLCGIVTCTTNPNHLPDKVYYSSQSRDAGVDEYHFYSSNMLEFFIPQNLMKGAAHRFEKCRVQVDADNMALSCDWKLFNIFTFANKDVNRFGDCKCNSTCLIACQLDISKPLQGGNFQVFIAAGIMGFLSITSAVFFLLCDFCTEDTDETPSLEDTDTESAISQSTKDGQRINENKMFTDHKSEDENSLSVDYNTKVHVSITDELDEKCKEIPPQLDYEAIWKFWSNNQSINKADEMITMPCGFGEDIDHPFI